MSPSSTKRTGRYLKLLLFLLPPPLLLGVILLLRPQLASQTDYVSVAMIPPPNFQLKFNSEGDINQTTLANTLSAHPIQIGSNLVEAETALAKLKTQAYEERPDLFVIEEYREIPRRWFETNSHEVMLLQNKDAAVSAMQDLLKVAALEDLLTNNNFAVFISKVVQSFPPELLAENFTNNIVTQIDSRIGYTRTTSVSATNISANPSEYIKYTLDEIKARRPYLDKTLQREKGRFQVDDAFIATLKVRLAVNLLTGFADYYIGLNTPPRLEKQRTKVRKMRIEFSNATK
jgi:hypothetical protein